MILQVQDLDVHYGIIQALWGVNFTLNEGEIVSIIGANGAGKTTLLRTIMGLIKPTRGRIIYMGQPIHRKVEKQVANGLVLVPEGRQIFTNLTVRENLLMGGYLIHNQKDEMEKITAHVFELFPILSKRYNQLAGTLSGGEQQMLAIGRALLSKPKVLLLDEPSLGLAPMLINEVFSVLKEINQEGTSIVLVEQNARKALRISQRSYVLENGRVLKSGNSQELLEDPEVIKAYLGA